MADAAASRRLDVLMLGPPIDGRGGMSSVVAAYRDSGLLEREGVRYVASTAEGKLLAKIARGGVALAAVAAGLLSRRVALLHIHVASGASFWRKACFCWMAFAARRPVVLHVHGGNFHEFYRLSPGWAQVYIRATFARVARVVVLSPAWIDRLAVLAPRRCFSVIWNPVTSWPVSRLAPNRHFRLLFLGRLERDKGVFDLVAAFAQALGGMGDAVLQIAGEGDREPVIALARDLGVADRVMILGWIEGESKRQVLADASVFVLPSYVEGLPVAMLEAMHCGVPVVTCPVGSIPEVAIDGVQALFVPPGDVAALALALRKVYDDHELADRLGRAGRRLYESRFSMTAVEPAVHQLYAEIAPQR